MGCSAMVERQLRAGQREFRALMESAQWTGAETARRLGVSHAAVYFILQGRNNPKNTTLELLRRLVEDETGKRGPEDAMMTRRTAPSSRKQNPMCISPADTPDQSPLIDAPISEAADLVEKLAFLRQQAPVKYKAARAIIEALHRETKSGRHKPRGRKKK